MVATVALANETLSRISAGVVFPPSYEAWAALGERGAEADYQGISPWIVFMLPVDEVRIPPGQSSVWRY